MAASLTCIVTRWRQSVYANDGVTGKRRIAQAGTSATPSFTHFDAVVIGLNKVAVAYELRRATPTPRTRIYVSVVEVAPPRRHAAGR